MPKIKVETPRPSIYPVPTLLLTCDDGEGTNIITISWAGILCSRPPIISVSIQPQRYSYNLIKEQQHFTVNIPSAELLFETDYCGNISGKDVNKAQACDFTLIQLDDAYPKAIVECRHHLLCDIVDTREWGGTHTTFMAEVKHEFINDDCYLGDSEYSYQKVNPIAYCRKDYFQLEKAPSGYYGYSLRKTSYIKSRGKTQRL